VGGADREGEKEVRWDKTFGDRENRVGLKEGGWIKTVEGQIWDLGSAKEGVGLRQEGNVLSKR